MSAHLLPHPLLGHRVRDIASGTVGKLTVVVREEIPMHRGSCQADLAYISPEAGGQDLPTAVGDIEATGSS
ncbi:MULTISPECIES: hypothetical protein [unclassified Streptomyces]|uniref:hypothetical protein n=1 Tax=unclassified Streptomyces TaxID=2593676 RepID=UPI00214C74B7|nr:hypothetical protein [Streptomyces sp. NBC_00162]UUU37599.1 hypothetical protein JIW86_00830 [Streptomyces sp. NBC_00162]